VLLLCCWIGVLASLIVWGDDLFDGLVDRNRRVVLLDARPPRDLLDVLPGLKAGDSHHEGVETGETSAADTRQRFTDVLNDAIRGHITHTTNRGRRTATIVPVHVAESAERQNRPA
jgi:hypothetical protein